MMGHGFLWFHYIPLIKHMPVHIVAAGFVTLIIFIISLVINRAIKRYEEGVVPSSKLSFQNIAEVGISAILQLLTDIIGPRGYQFLPIIGSTFVFIFISNLMGVIPGFAPPTTNINTNAAMAIVILLVTHYYGVKEHGVKYIRHFTGPVWWLSWMFIVIEFISLVIIRPMSLSLRLFGNMTGDHMVLSIFSSLVPIFIPVVFMVLAIFVSFIQALVFSLLSMLYIGSAISHDH